MVRQDWVCQVDPGRQVQTKKAAPLLGIFGGADGRPCVPVNSCHIRLHIPKALCITQAGGRGADSPVAV